MECVNTRNSRRKGTVKIAGILLSVSFVISSTWFFKENDLHKPKYKNQLYQMSAMQNIFSVNSNVHKLEDEKVLLRVSTGKNGIKERKCSECGMNFYSTYECPHKETHIAVTKESTVTEIGEESIICSECGTVLEKRIVPRKQSTKGNANQTTSDTASKEGNISDGKQNKTEDAALENNMISVPQIGLKSVFTQGPFTQNAVDANDILLAYAFGLGENDPFILGHNTHSLKNLRNIQVGTNIYLNLNGILETYQVVVSELGQATEDQSDIRGINSGETIYRNLGVKTLHMYTCDYSVSNVRIYFNLQQRRMKIMKRISDELFVTGENRTYSLDDVIAIRIQDGEFYFLGWMENAERYSIQWAKSNSKIERDLLIASDDIYDAITSCKDYNKVENDWLMDDKGNLINKDDHEYRNPYEKFLSCINPYQRNGKSDPDDHNIFLMTQKEFGDCIDALRDGDYVFVIE